MTVPNYEFDLITKQYEDPAVTAALEMAKDIESRINNPELSDSDIQSILGDNLKGLNDTWPYKGKMIRLSGDLFLKNKQGAITDIAQCKNEIVVSDGFGIACAVRTPESPAPTLRIVHNLALPLEDEVVDCIAYRDDVLIDYQDPQLTSQSL